jgi:predicted RNase H-like HicB family nuclease
LLAHYVGILDGSGDNWGIRIPDLPGCHGAGDSAESAISDAISAALEWVEYRAAKGMSLPTARKLADTLQDEDGGLQANELAVMIQAPTNS